MTRNDLLELAVVNRMAIDVGNHFEGSAEFTLGAGAVSNTIFLTGSKPVRFSGRTIIFNGEGLTAEIFENPTYTGGTPADYQNSNAANPKVGESQIIVGSTVSVDGDLIFAPVFAYGSTGFGNSTLSSENQFENTKIMQPNTPYLLRITSISAGQKIASHLTWIEE